MNNICILLIFILCIGCASNDTEYQIGVDELIKGSWATARIEDGWRHVPLVFSFRDSTASSLYPFGDFAKYQINGDTLVIRNIWEFLFNTVDYDTTLSFYIDSISTDTMVLTPISQTAVKMIKEQKGYQYEKLYLSKIKKNQNNNITTIGFRSTGCYGTCAAMHLELDLNGTFYFHGGNYAKKQGYFSGQLSQRQTQELFKLTDNLNLSELNDSYIAGWTDDQTTYIGLKTSDTTFYTKVYGYDTEPIELRILIERLSQLYKEVELTQDSSVINNLNEGFHYVLYEDVPPPPPIILIDE